MSVGLLDENTFIPTVLLSSSRILWLQEALPRSPRPGVGVASPERLEAWTEIVGSCPACFWGGAVVTGGFPAGPVVKTTLASAGDA